VVQGVVSLGAKRQEYEADNSPPFNTKVKNGGAIPPPPHTSSRRGAELIKPRGNFALTEYRDDELMKNVSVP
jgi:hypothetical protein